MELRIISFGCCGLVIMKHMFVFAFVEKLWWKRRKNLNDLTFALINSFIWSKVRGNSNLNFIEFIWNESVAIFHAKSTCNDVNVCLGKYIALLDSFSWKKVILMRTKSIFDGWFEMATTEKEKEEKRTANWFSIAWNDIRLCVFDMTILLN